MSLSLNKKRKVRIASMLAVALIATRAGVAAAGGISVEPQCPSSISPGANLTVELRLANTTQTQTYIFNSYNNGTTQKISQQISTGETFTIAKSGLIAHIGNLNVLGPFVIPLAETLEPQPPITYDTTITPTPPPPTPAQEESITTKGYLNVAFPTTAVKGTFTNMLIYVLDQKNKTLGSGSCVIEVQ